MLHQGTVWKDESLAQFQEAKVPGFFYLMSDLQYQHDQCECWSVTGKGRNSLQTSTKHLIFYLPFDCILGLSCNPQNCLKVISIPKLL